MKLYLVTTLDGMRIVWCLADPKLGEREVAAELLGHAHDLAALPAGVVLIGDKGLRRERARRVRRGAAGQRPYRTRRPHDPPSAPLRWLLAERAAA